MSIHYSEHAAEKVWHSRSLITKPPSYLATSEAWQTICDSEATEKFDFQERQLIPNQNMTLQKLPTFYVGDVAPTDDKKTIAIELGHMASATDRIPLAVGYTAVIDEFVFRTSGTFDTGLPFTFDLKLPETITAIGTPIILNNLYTSNIAVVKVAVTLFAATVANYAPEVKLICTASTVSGKWLDIVRRCSIVTRTERQRMPRIASDSSFEEIDLDEQDIDSEV